MKILKVLTLGFAITSLVLFSTQEAKAQKKGSSKSTSKSSGTKTTVHKDKSGMKTGTTTTTSKGKEIMRDSKGRKTGTYDPKSGVTRDAQNRTIKKSK
ncbi:MAG: hypothetical protein EAY69_08100 [Cytophagales bacterium]|nr:MAG: hypothetical protein EAY69_08100 [Cytophagales bacterium]